MILRDSDRYFTPRWIVDLVIEQFGGVIDCDPCSDPLSDIPATHRFDAREDVDGLVKPWVGKCWVNPPYSDVQPWVLRAVQHAASGGEVVMLINASTDTSYWTSYVFEHGTVAFVNKRVKFTNYARPRSSTLVETSMPSSAPGRLTRRSSRRSRRQHEGRLVRRAQPARTSSSDQRRTLGNTLP